MIKLDLYRLLPEQHDMGFVDEPDVDCRYTPYRIFVLETRLFPLIYSMFQNIENIDIYPKSIYNPKMNRMEVYLKIAKIDDNTIEKEDDSVTLTEEQREKIQSEINKITSENIDYVLIDVNELYKSSGKQYPFSWFVSVLEYSLPDTSYNPFIQKEGIYLKFNLNSDYKNAYYKTCKKILKKIEQYHSHGVVIIDDNSNIVKNWDLVSIDNEEIVKRIFQPKWTDRRFAPKMVDFLILKIQGDSYISFSLPNNLTKRHGIMKKLEGYESFIESSTLKVKCENIQEATKIANLVDYGYAKTYGRVMILEINRKSEAYLFSDYCTRNNIGESIAYYNDNKILFSVLLNEKHENVDTHSLSVSFRNYSISRLTEVIKISKFKGLSPHDIIEQEYSIRAT
jgi:hypothetical protein